MHQLARRSTGMSEHAQKFLEVPYDHTLLLSTKNFKMFLVQIFDFILSLQEILMVLILIMTDWKIPFYN